MGYAYCILLVLAFGAKGVRALWTGELHGRGRSATRRADNPLGFYGTVGVLLFFPAVILDTMFGFQLLVKLVMKLAKLNL